MLDQIDIDTTDLLYTLSKICKIMMPCINMTQRTDINKDALATAEREAIKKIDSMLEHANISCEVFWSTFNIAMENPLAKRIAEGVINDFSVSDEDKTLLFAPIVTLIGQPSRKGIAAYVFNFDSKLQEDEENLSPTNRIFYESLCQQLRRRCGIVCAFAYKGKPCCGAKERLLTLYKRLPREERTHFKSPNCDSIR
jgi:hypothetical protein